MHYRGYAMLGQDATDDFTVPCIADNQRAAGDGRAKSGAEVIQNDDIFAGFTQLTNHVAAYVAGSSCDEYPSLNAP